MKKKIRIFSGILIVVVCGILVSYNVCLRYYHESIINSTPDMSSWNLKNETYTVYPTIENKNISFHVEDSEGEIVYKSEESWRTWDFESINIDENNCIIVVSNDTGKEIYAEQNGAWEKE